MKKEIIKETEDGTTYVLTQTFKMEEPIRFVPMTLICLKEDDHSFDSTGQCRTCGSHRAPAR